MRVMGKASDILTSHALGPGSIPSIHQKKKCHENRQILWLHHLL